MASGFGCILSLELWNEAAAESSQCLPAHPIGEIGRSAETLLDKMTLKTWHPKGEHLHVFGEQKLRDRWNDEKCSEHLRTF